MSRQKRPSDRRDDVFRLLPDEGMPATEHEEWFEADLELASLADLLERKSFAPHDREAISSICLPDLEAEELGEEYESEFEVDPRLTARFQLWNQRFFDGRLLPYAIRLGPLVESYELWGLHVRARRTILLEDDLPESLLNEVLIHEMCHAKTNDRHGARFAAELTRIASMGSVSAARALAALDMIRRLESRRRRRRGK